MSAIRALLALGLLTLASLLFAGPASAIYDHSKLEDEFPVGCAIYAGSTIQDIAIDEDDELVYVFCETGESQSDRIYRYDFEGNPVAFTATKSYISGNELTGNPGAPGGTLNSGFAGPHMAVDNSGGPHDGEIYIVVGGSGLSGGTENVSIFKPTGEYAGSLEQPEFGGGSTNDVSIGPDGSVYVLSTTRLSKYNAAYNEVARFYTGDASTFSEGNRVEADSKGAVWTVANGPKKYEPDQLFPNFSPAFGADSALFTGMPSPFAPYPLTTGGGAFNSHIAIDTTRNDIYVHRGPRIEVYSEGNAADPAYKNAPNFGEGLVGENGIAVTKDGLVFASVETGFGIGEDAVVVFGPGEILPDIHTDPADVEKVDHDGAELTGAVDLDGGTPVVSCKLDVGLTAGNYNKATVPCAPPAFAANSPISAVVGGLETGVEYHYRFSATNAKGTNVGGDRTFTPAFVLKVKTLPATTISEKGATLRGQLDPDGKPTDYYFEYGVDTNYGQETPTLGAGSGSGVVNVGQPVTDLPAGRLFHYRIVTEDENGDITRGEDLTFRTASVPEVSGLRATDLTETSATLHATINPQGFPTEYHFEYGPSVEYGQSIPAPDEALGSGSEPINVEQTITGLTPGVTYHFRAVATNVPWGTAVSTDTTFDFAPPNCPNAHARQLTASTYLPDCRAYELVSPGAAGAVSLYPGKETWDLFDGSQDPLNEDGAWPQNYGLASSPPRLMFYGILGTIQGLAAPNLLTPDAYLATRTASGWKTTLPGFDDNHGIPSGKQCAEDFSLCLEFNTPIENEVFESEAWVHTAEGKFVGKLPTNSDVVVGANEYKGFRRISPDFTNYAFSSNETTGIFSEKFPGFAFTVDGLTSGAGSAYDNDLGARTVKLISRLPGGGHIPQNGTSDRPIQFPAISENGSHILMLTEGGKGAGLIGPPYRLYMSVNDSLFYEVSKGDAVEFVGMTRDGSSVTFTSAQKLTGTDTDTSIDLYRWSESTDSLTLLSVGNSKGNSDACSASWTQKCGVEVPNTERRYALYQDFHPGESNPLEDQPFFGAPGMDDVTAEGTGDVYFYSPELLDGSKFGIPNQKNLYVVRDNGQVQLVASLEPGTEVQRSTVSTDGKFAAILTESKLTSYDNVGFRQVYVYDREEETLVCASCRPGLPPTKDVAVSQGGKFMADDGRAFFATEDSLVPRDKNGDIYDVYEYVGGRPQLISSGLASRDFTGETTILGLFAKPQYTGLEAVSRDGIDVYFSTFSTLVDEDFNGQYIKFYDARTGGGFPQATVNAPCGAADECHGADSVPPTPPTVASEIELGATGNVREERPGRKCTRRRNKGKKSSTAKRKHLKKAKACKRSTGRAGK